ncbi:MAG: formylglycine-generating enzyme family protein, partial [Anaerolineae bacterium]|nr:formylglycine-generating enzyme family protein [Anaerolineae bacterium]
VDVLYATWAALGNNALGKLVLPKILRRYDGVLFEVGGKETKAAARQVQPPSRKTDLEVNIHGSYQIVRQYEGIIHDTDRPEERTRAQRVIQEQWELIRGYLAEYRALAGDKMPDDINEIAVSAAARLAKEEAAAEADRKAKEEVERKAAEEVARKAKQEQERKAREERERQARAAAERKEQLLALLPEPILIPAGSFLMGSDPQKDKNAGSDEQPQHTVYLSDYCICKTMITNAQYLAFVQAGGRKPPQYWQNGRIPQGKENHPVVCVSWHDAVAFCAWVTQELQMANGEFRLPTEAEWEKAARGTDGRIYPWGNEPPDATRCNFNMNVGDTTPVGQYPAGASPYGLLDMAGNVWEWCADWYEEIYYRKSPAQSPPGPPDGSGRVLRGGAWNDPEYRVRVAYRLVHDPFFSNRYVGFRCVRSGSG